ncbi:MAG: hypothetical protein CMP48_05810 [Rickettsiales bacterium]|nr:hypothetical protein [Rickettsiales bacterium]
MISKEQIQDQALVLFSRYGLKSVNMDDLAKELSVSKKTLYQVYSSKEDLVLSLFEKISSSWDEQVDEILESLENPMQKFLRFTLLRYQFVKRLNPSFLLRSGKQYEKVYSYMMNITRNMEQIIVGILHQAKEEHQLRSDVNVEVFFNVHELIFNAYFEQYNPVVPGSRETFKHMIIAPIAGICEKEEFDIWTEFDSLISTYN